MHAWTTCARGRLLCRWQLNYLQTCECYSVTQATLLRPWRCARLVLQGAQLSTWFVVLLTVMDMLLLSFAGFGVLS